MKKCFIRICIVSLISFLLSQVSLTAQDQGAMEETNSQPQEAQQTEAQVSEMEPSNTEATQTEQTAPEQTEMPPPVINEIPATHSPEPEVSNPIPVENSQPIAEEPVQPPPSDPTPVESEPVPSPIPNPISSEIPTELIATGAAAFMTAYLGSIGLVLILVIASLWKLFSKAGEPGWASIVPIYNIIVLCKICGKPVWWFVLLLIPCVNLIISIILYIALAKSFGKDTLFAIGIIFLPFIFLPILAFGSSEYVGQTEG